MCVDVPEDEHQHAAPQLPVKLVGALVDSDDSYIPGACARPDGESGDSTVTLTC